MNKSTPNNPTTQVTTEDAKQPQALNEWINIKVAFEHRKQLGNAFWLYIHYQHITQSGLEYSDPQASQMMEMPLMTVRRHRRILQKMGYMPRPDVSGYVYLVRAENQFVKIGIADNPEKRISNLQTGSPLELELIWTFHTKDAPSLEAELHTKYRDKHQRSEWFALSEEDIDDIEREYPNE